MSFPISEAQPIEHAAALPAECDVVVVGGGVIGVTAALFLRRKGLRVTLLEKGRIAGEQSSRNWGWIRQQGRDPDELPISTEAIALWKQLSAECGEDIGLAPGGTTYIAHSQAELAEFEDWLPHAKAQGVDTTMLSAAETEALIPGMTGKPLGAMRTPSDMRGEPWKAVPALARLAAREGVLIREGCAVRGLEVEAGRIAGVATEAGRLRAPQVLVAGGAWSSLLLRQAGIRIPQLAVRGTVAATGPLPEIHAGAATDARIAFRRRQDGGYTLGPAGFHEAYMGRDLLRHMRAYLATWRTDPFGTRPRLAAPAGFPDAWRTPRRFGPDEVTPFERMRVLNPAPNARAAAAMQRNFAALFPQLGPITLRAAWAGMIDAMPDVVPIASRCEALEGLTIGTGMSAHGFGIGPGFGRVLADLVAGDPPGHDLSRFRFSRFTDGSPIRPGPAL
ncbi:NAD(P)/FAD-dependent oxidoreductase [Pseudoroseicyclus aestuarii]|uniref:Glycine/D-amino acid oxidase-like deaminating enzyme n=1 Tax=Pseudoroseicyclus aestuarii TaxID=1795041 RepID=A0A318ST17_9RHOB|nr:FAD-binding oxidoreductase [Pseudoroseicyclus aestuarii]PYE84853.1 glycine/D-amino acid oxidase-like deaminating enzyme [Pseudoroseicyclus aestuarii]